MHVTLQTSTLKYRAGKTTFTVLQVEANLHHCVQGCRVTLPLILGMSAMLYHGGDHGYQRLDTAKKQFRLLILEPATNVEDEVQCKVFSTSLYNGPIYETLSYCWGDAKTTAPILFHGQPTQVTTNLVSALRHLRRVNGVRTLWVDALCINQQDVTERRDQIKIMREIYESSMRTVLWLGCGKDIPLSPQTLAILRQTFTQDLRLGASEANARLLSLDQSTLRTFAGEFCAIMTESDVWNRAWVAQEVTVTRNLVLLYGIWELPWWSTTCLFFGIYEILRVSFDDFIGPMFVEKNANNTVLVRRYTAFSGGSEGFKPSLFASYLVFGSLKATMPVDHIYALLGLSNDSDALGIEADYNITVQELMRKLVRSHIRRYHDLNFLELGTIFPSDAEWETSWTPNVNNAVRVFPLAQSTGNQPAYAAGLNSRGGSWNGVEDVSDPKKLILLGIRLDTVREVTDTTSARRLSPEGTREMFLKTLPADPDSTYGNGQTKFDAYWRTLMFDATPIARLQYSEVDAFRTAFRNLLNGHFPAQHAQTFEQNDFQITVSFAAGTIPSNFALTCSGLMARVPMGTQEGDVVAVLYGGRTPFVLRPRPENNKEFLLVGPAYVHGYMDGEVFTWRDAGSLEEQKFILV